MKAREYFVVANSFAAPFFSDTSERFVEAPTARAALEEFVRGYRHPCGLFFAAVYEDANAERKGRDPLFVHVSNHELEHAARIRGMSSHSYFGHRPGDFEINHVKVRVPDPLGGRIMSWPEWEDWKAS